MEFYIWAHAQTISGKCMENKIHLLLPGEESIVHIHSFIIYLSQASEVKMRLL